MTKTYDLEYITGNIFTAFFPNTSHGESAWRTIAEHTDGTGKVLNCQAVGTIAQLRRAGYSVRKAPSSGVTSDDILGELME